MNLKFREDLQVFQIQMYQNLVSCREFCVFASESRSLQGSLQQNRVVFDAHRVLCGYYKTAINSAVILRCSFYLHRRATLATSKRTTCLCQLASAWPEYPALDFPRYCDFLALSKLARITSRLRIRREWNFAEQWHVTKHLYLDDCSVLL